MGLGWELCPIQSAVPASPRGLAVAGRLEEASLVYTCVPRGSASCAFLFLSWVIQGPPGGLCHRPCLQGILPEHVGRGEPSQAEIRCRSGSAWRRTWSWRGLGAQGCPGRERVAGRAVFTGVLGLSMGMEGRIWLGFHWPQRVPGSKMASLLCDCDPRGP